MTAMIMVKISIPVPKLPVIASATGILYINTHIYNIFFIHMNAADKATFRYMIDPGIVHKHDDIQEETPLDTADVEFYKERIKDLTAHLLEDGSTDDSLNKQFNDYTKACIAYLRTSDVHDAFQEKYKNMVSEPSIGKHPGIDAIYNDQLVCRPPRAKSIKDFVIVKTKQSPTSFPTEETFDAHDSRFKNKRLGTKENIDIVYGKNKKVVEENQGKIHQKEKKGKEKKGKEKKDKKTQKKDS